MPSCWRYFIRHANTVVTRDALAADLWSGKAIDLRSIDVAIVRLRQALQEESWAA